MLLQKLIEDGFLGKGLGSANAMFLNYNREKKGFDFMVIEVAHY